MIDTVGLEIDTLASGFARFKGKGDSVPGLQLSMWVQDWKDLGRPMELTMTLARPEPTVAVLPPT